MNDNTNNGLNKTKSNKFNKKERRTVEKDVISNEDNEDIKFNQLLKNEDVSDKEDMEDVKEKGDLEVVTATTANYSSDIYDTTTDFKSIGVIFFIIV